MTTQTIYHADCLEWMKAQPDRIIDLTVTSPPYEDARTYGIGFKLKGQEWVDWCIPRVVEMCRVTNGLVIFNAAGKVREWKYSPVTEWLVADLTRNHGLVCGPAPYVFHRIGIPGSGNKHYHRRDWEPVYAFALADRLPVPWSDNTAMGHAPKWMPGGAMTYRGQNGERRHKTRGTSGHNLGQGKRAQYHPPGTLDRAVTEIANPGNVIKCKVGGGLMGSRIAHQNEAPFPEKLAEFFIRSYCKPDGIVFDPCAGSGTVLAVAKRTGRNAVGCDVRESQCNLVRRRLATVQPELF